MRILNKFFIFAVSAVLLAACSKSSTAVSDDGSYNREGSIQEVENTLRNKVFAAYSGEGQFYAMYALATVVKNMDAYGYYRVKFVTGPYQGEIKKTKDVIIKTQGLRPEDVQKSQVVIYDSYNPKKFKDSPHDRWEKAIVYDERQAKDGRVMLEFPHDSNDFMATREAAYPSNIRLIVDPPAADPRRFLP